MTAFRGGLRVFRRHLRAYRARKSGSGAGGRRGEDPGGGTRGVVILGRVCWTHQAVGEGQGVDHSTTAKVTAVDSTLFSTNNEFFYKVSIAFAAAAGYLHSLDGGTRWYTGFGPCHKNRAGRSYTRNTGNTVMSRNRMMQRAPAREREKTH